MEEGRWKQKKEEERGEKRRGAEGDGRQMKEGSNCKGDKPGWGRME